MDEATFSLRVERLRQVNDAIAGLDANIRSQAFELLRPYVEGVSGQSRHRDNQHTPPAHEDEEAEHFFDSHPSDKDADNAHASAAYWYSLYGKNPFHLDDLRRIASEGGVDLPERLDVTISGAQREKKPLYRRTTLGRYKPTPHGERHLQTTYSVTKGRAAPPAADPES